MMTPEKSHPDHLTYPVSRKPGLIAILFPAVIMCMGAVALAGWQWFRMEKMKPAEKPVTVAFAEVKSVPKPQPVEVVKPVEPEKPPEPAVKPETIAARRGELEKLEKRVQPARLKSNSASADLKTRLTSLSEAQQKTKLARLSQDTAGTELESIEARLGAVANRQDALLKDLKTIAATPKPPREGLSGFSPVARPAKGKEYHFEVQQGRVAYIDLEKLMELVKKDVQIRMRLSGSPRGIRSEVGPIGEFGLAYEIGPAADSFGSSGLAMKGWEVMPQRDPRGETLEQASQPLSEYQRTLKNLSPGEATITMWVYPSGFGIFRALRDQLHAQGFMVAARPLPEGIPVRGSPSGSLSAGQ